jgi:hypothetical protein
MGTKQEKALATFTEYFVKNYPGPRTIIGDPNWHAPKIFRAAEFALKDAGLLAKEPGVPVALPSWKECEAAVDRGKATALQTFIHSNEPADPRGEDEFRDQLAKLLQEIAK